MGNTGDTQVGKFCISAVDTSNGHITVFTDGAPLRRKIGLFKDVVDADNRIEGFYRPGDNNIVITVNPEYRDEGTMRIIFASVYKAIREILDKNPDLVAQITGAETVLNPARLIDELMSDA